MPKKKFDIHFDLADATVTILAIGSIAAIWATPIAPFVPVAYLVVHFGTKINNLPMKVSKEEAICFRGYNIDNAVKDEFPCGVNCIVIGKENVKNKKDGYNYMYKIAYDKDAHADDTKKLDCVWIPPRYLRPPNRVERLRMYAVLRRAQEEVMRIQEDGGDIDHPCC